MRNFFPCSIVIVISLLGTPARAQMEMQKPMTIHSSPADGPADCGPMTLWDYAAAMCMPRSMVAMPMRMVMLHGNSFFTQTLEEGRRGRNAFSVPNMFMLDVGSSVGASHYLNFEFMGTLERWTFPEAGYPELLQIGEHQENGAPFIDSQHPHSSPIMGLTLGDTFSFGEGKDHLKFWFSPRGSSTDGPVPFMHRPTGMVNPDAPLGHHIGQDVGHITSTVFGGLLHLNQTTFEASTFYGAEPEPLKVDLPLGGPNSYAVRLTQQFSPTFYAMTSAAFVKHPEPHDPSLDHVWRYSASFYNSQRIGGNWKLNSALIWGLINGYDEASALNSFADEFWFHRGNSNIWGRIEVLQRTPDELEIMSASSPNSNGQSDLHKPQWVKALTLGYTHRLIDWGSADLSLGGSVTKDFLPREFQSAYSGEPWAAKVFLKLSGMKMFSY